MEQSARIRDRDVRAAVHRKVLAEHHDDPNTLVIEELGLQHGRCRVDIAVINGQIRGYELKSDADTLDRLPGQEAVYSRILDRVTLVVGERHAHHVEDIIPDWWGIKIAVQGPRGAVHLLPRRPSLMNPSIDAKALAQLLWRPEALAILQELGVPDIQLRKNRAALYSMLAEYLELADLRKRVRHILKARDNWRRPSRPS